MKATPTNKMPQAAAPHAAWPADSPAGAAARPHQLKRGETGKLLFFLLITAGSGLVFILTPELMPSALISVLLFFTFGPVIDALERKGIQRMVAIAAVFLACGLGIAGAVSWIVPRVTQEIEAFEKGSSRYVEQITAKLKTQEEKVLGKIPMLRSSHSTEKTIAWLKDSGDKLWRLIPNLASQLMLALFLVPFLTLVLLKDGREIRRKLLRLVPNRYFETTYSISTRILDEMGGYVAARILEAFLVMVLVTLGCVALKIPYAILFGIFAGATNPIPYIGMVIGAVPGLMLAILDPSIHNQLLWTAVIFVAANAIDMFVIFPIVVAKIVNLHPVVVIISVILGSQIFGVLGMILAVPVTSICKILLSEIYAKIYSESSPSFTSRIDV